MIHCYANRNFFLKKFARQTFPVWIFHEKKQTHYHRDVIYIVIQMKNGSIVP